VHVVPVAGAAVLADVDLRPARVEADLHRLRPVVADVAGGAPGVAADVGVVAPLPDVVAAVLADAEHDVARGLVEDGAHQPVRLLLPLDARGRRAVAAPVVLEVVHPPLAPLRHVLLLVALAGFEALAGRRAGAAVDAELEALG